MQSYCRQSKATKITVIFNKFSILKRPFIVLFLGFEDGWDGWDMWDMWDELDELDQLDQWDCPTCPTCPTGLTRPPQSSLSLLFLCFSLSFI